MDKHHIYKIELTRLLLNFKKTFDNNELSWYSEEDTNVVGRELISLFNSSVFI